MSRTWFITGSSRGLGRAIAQEALEHSADRVVLTARNPDDVADLVARYSDRTLALRLDVTDPSQVRAAVGAAVAAFGGLDVVINNAGYAEICAFEETTSQAFREQMEVNFFGVVEVCRAVVPHMRERRRGHIVQMSAISGRMGVAGLAADTAAKFALEGFSESLALELATHRINVTLIEPGGVRTDWGGASMSIPPVGDAYQATVGELARLVTENRGKEPSDPRLCARSIMKLVQSPHPPLRLVLGRDALDAITKYDHERAVEDAKWRFLSDAVDYPDNPDNPDGTEVTGEEGNASPRQRAQR